MASLFNLSNELICEIWLYIHPTAIEDFALVSRRILKLGAPVIAKNHYLRGRYKAFIEALKHKEMMKVGVETLIDLKDYIDNLEKLELVNINAAPRCLFLLLAAHRSLESLTYRPCADLQIREFYPSVALKALASHATNSLRTLDIRACGHATKYMGSLENFPCLKFLTTNWELVLSNKPVSSSVEATSLSLPPSEESIDRRSNLAISLPRHLEEVTLFAEDNFDAEQGRIMLIEYVACSSHQQHLRFLIIKQLTESAKRVLEHKGTLQSAASDIGMTLDFDLSMTR